MITDSEPFNQLYLVVRDSAETVAGEFPAVSEALSEFLGTFPNLYESPDQAWEFSQPLGSTLQARVSEALVETRAAIDPSMPSVVEGLLQAVDLAITHTERLRKEEDSAWLERVKEAAERFGPVFAAKPAAETRQVTLSQPEEDRFRLHRFKCRIPVHITGKTEGQKGNVVQIGSGEAVITDVPFGLFLRLVVALLDTEDGFVALGNMQSGGGLSDEGFYEPAGVEQALSRLRQPFRTALGHLKTNEFIERRRGNIRLSTGSPYVTWDRKALLDHPDGVIRELARKLPETQGTEEISPAP